MRGARAAHGQSHCLGDSVQPMHCPPHPVPPRGSPLIVELFNCSIVWRALLVTPLLCSLLFWKIASKNSKWILSSGSSGLKEQCAVCRVHSLSLAVIGFGHNIYITSIRALNGVWIIQSCCNHHLNLYGLQVINITTALLRLHATWTPVRQSWKKPTDYWVRCSSPKVTSVPNSQL